MHSAANLLSFPSKKKLKFSRKPQFPSKKKGVVSKYHYSLAEFCSKFATFWRKKFQPESCNFSGFAIDKIYVT